MALTPITSYPVPHDNGSGSGGNTYITGGRKSSTYNSLNVNSINAKFGNIDNLQSQSISANDGMILYLQSKEGMITKISGDQLDYRNGYIGSLVADDIGVKKLKAEDIEAMNGFIKTLQSKEITTEYLTVTKQAHFFELIIDKIRSVGGQLIITPASCVADYVKGYIPGIGLVEPTESNYDSITYFVIYWRAEDNDGRNVDNGFLENDQAICQSFNVHEGTNNNVANKYYWRLVQAIDSDIYINLTTGAEMSLETGAHTENKNNEYYVTMFDTKTKKGENEYFNNGINWTVNKQEITGINTNVDWRELGSLDGAAVHGMFVSASQVYGIQITPDKDNLTSYLEFIITQKVEDTAIVPTKINIGVYFKDDTFKIWNEVPLDNDRDNFGHVRLDLEDADAPIEAITIVSTADVNWHRCHRMKLSNYYEGITNNGQIVTSLNVQSTPTSNSGCDYIVSKLASIPSAGDNIVQLGYRTSYNNPEDDPNINRQSAIIISAYKSIDNGGMLEDETVVDPIVAPSYAQYIGIDDFHLYTHRQSYIDGKGARFIGDISLCSVNGKALTDTIQDSVKMILVDTASVMMNTQEGSNTVTSLTPSTINIKMLTVIDDDTVQLDTVPEGYRVQLTYYNASNQVVSNVRYEYNAITPTSLSNISLLMNTDVNAISRLQISLDKVVSVSPDKIIIIDTKEIPYIRAANATTAGRYEFRYCNYIPTQANPLPVKPDDYSDGIGTFGSQIRCTWDTSVVSPDSSNGEYTYMSQCFRNAGGSYGVWTNPIRITGANGKDGEDGSDIEYIYTQNDSGVAPPKPSGTNWPDDWPNDGNTDHQTITNSDSTTTTWWDNPQGVLINRKYEYVSMRQKSHGGNWSEYSTPVIWSKWGEKGQDGDGYEYIFKLQASLTPPTDPTPPNYATDTTYQNSNEYAPYLSSDGWTDDPSSVTQSKPYLFVSVRQRKSGQGWGKFSDPSLWARYAEQGETGGHYEFRYKNSTAQPNAPTGTGLTDDWSDIPTNPDIAHNEYTWMSQSYVTPATPNDHYGTWSPPVRITGGDGTPGTDGTDIEFIYAQSVYDTPKIPAPPTNQIDDWPNDGTTDHQTITNSNGTQTTWYDNPQGVTNIVKYEWMSMRFKTGGHNGVGGTWSAYTTPVIWSAYGDKGQDGDGFEYIYTITGGATPESNKPTAPTPNNWAYDTEYQRTDREYVPTGWTDDPKDTTPTNRWQWVCVRKRQARQWQPFSTPSLWSNYSLAEDAIPGSDGKDAELDILVPIKEAFYADLKTAMTNNNTKAKLKLNLEYALNKKVGNDVTTQSWTGYTLTCDLYTSTYIKLTNNPLNLSLKPNTTNYYYSNSDILYAISNNNIYSKVWGSNSDWREASTDKTVENGTANWLKLPAYAQVTLKKNNKVVSEPRIVPLEIDGGAFLKTMDDKIVALVGGTIYNYNGGLEGYLQTSYASKEMLQDQVTQTVNTLTMSKSDIENAFSEVRQTANEFSVNVTNSYTTTADLKTRLNNAGIQIGANNSEKGYINLNADNTNVNGTLNVYNKSGVGIAVWNGTKSTATNSTQLVNKSLGTAQGWSISNLSGGDHVTALNIIGIDGILLNSTGVYANRYKKFLWWGDTTYDHISGSNGYEFIVRNLRHNFRVSENGIYRTSAKNIFNNWQDLDSFYESENKDILTNEDIRSGGAAGANMRWSDASTTTPVCTFSESSKNFTKDSTGTTNSKFPDAMFRSCGIFIAQGGNTTIWLPWPDYSIGRTLWFKCVNGNLTLKIAYPQSTGKIMLSGSNKLVNTYNAGKWSVQLVSDGVRWIVLQGALNDTDNN